MAKVTMRIQSSELTETEILELEQAEQMPAVYDEDSPKLSSEQLMQFHRFDEIPVKISPANVDIVKSFGKNYPIVLNKLLNLALNNRDLVRQCTS